MERGNFSAAAGFGFDPEKFGVFSTFSAFLEMVVSEITMARLNNCNVLCHFSHSGGKCGTLVLRFAADNCLLHPTLAGPLIELCTLKWTKCVTILVTSV
jgi:hypothetical protein